MNSTMMLADRCRRITEPVLQAAEALRPRGAPVATAQRAIQAARRSLAQLEASTNSWNANVTWGGSQEKLVIFAALVTSASQWQFAENAYWVYALVLDDDVPFDAQEAIG